MSNLFVGLDLGTSAVKVGLFDEGGRLLRLGRRAYRLYAPHPGWAEQEPAEWWEAACSALREVLAGADAGRIAAVGLSGQTPGHVLVTGSGRSLGRAIVWGDRRAVAEAAWLAERITQRQACDWTGYAFVSSAMQPPARLLWLKEHRPGDWNRCTAVVQPKDFIALQLTGRVATDFNSGFCLLHPETKCYHPDYLALLEMEAEKMPLALSPTDMAGLVTPGAAALTGLPAGTPVAIGTIDAWCDIIGCGGIEPGCAVDVVGTSEVVALITDRPVEGDGVFSSSLLEGRHWVGGPVQMGGAAIEWLAQGFYAGQVGADPCGRPSGRVQDPFLSQGIEAVPGKPDFEWVEAEAAAVVPGAEGLLFLPYLRGERTPIWDETARGAFVGLTDRHTRAHCARAAYEGVAFAVWDVLGRSLAAAGIRPWSLRVSGGGARSPLWNQIKADITGLQVQQMAVSDAACLGAAILAAICTENFTGLSDACAAMTHPAATFEPEAAHAALYKALFSLWQDLYPALRSIFSRLGQLDRPLGRCTERQPHEFSSRATSDPSGSPFVLPG